MKEREYTHMDVYITLSLIFFFFSTTTGVSVYNIFIDFTF